MKINVINLEIHVCTTEWLILIWIKNPISLVYVCFFRLLKMIKNLHCKYWTNWLIDWLLTYWLDLLRLLKSSDKVQDVNLNHCQYASTLICIDKRPMSHIAHPRVCLGEEEKGGDHDISVEGLYLSQNECFDFKICGNVHFHWNIKQVTWVPEYLNPKCFFILLEMKAQNQQIKPKVHYQCQCSL